ncbi:hypothetical protein EC990672_1614B, partial [Escherichia coli 99.0672]
CLIFLFAVY